MRFAAYILGAIVAMGWTAIVFLIGWAVRGRAERQREYYTQRLRYFTRDESGQVLIEYVLICALIGLACVVGSVTLASEINTGLSRVGSKLSKALIDTDPD